MTSASPMITGVQKFGKQKIDRKRGNMHLGPRKQKLIGEHKKYNTCRFCLSHKVAPIIDFGDVPLAGGFFKPGSTEKQFLQERLYPLTILFCKNCGLVQVQEVVDSKILFSDYFYFSSAIKTLTDHFTEYAHELATRFPTTKNVSVLEIGSNDGVFLRPLIKEGFRTLGVDPAANIVKPLIKEGFPMVCDFFGEKAAQKIYKDWGQTDIIVGSNSLAHIDDMHDVLRGVDLLLKDDGFLAMETHYLGNLIREFQYDMMYHEHQSYYSLYALNNFFALYDMEVFDIKPIPIHAGSMRYYVQRKGAQRKITARAQKLLAAEKELGLDTLQTFQSYSKQIAQEKKKLMTLLANLKKKGKKIAGYGASGRATIMMAYCGITADHLDFVIDDAPAKQGAYTPGNHLSIVSSDILNDPDNKPDYCLLFAWSFKNEIAKKNKPYLQSGGKFILPLPTVEIAG